MYLGGGAGLHLYYILPYILSLLIYFWPLSFFSEDSELFYFIDVTFVDFSVYWLFVWWKREIKKRLIENILSGVLDPIFEYSVLSDSLSSPALDIGDVMPFHAF